MDEHFDLLELAGEIRSSLARADRAEAWQRLAELARILGGHVRKEEAGIFEALKDQGDFLDAVEALQGEHATFDETLSELGLDDADLETHVEALLQELSEHIDKENLGIFPVAVVTLGAEGWATVSRAHDALVFG